MRDLGAKFGELVILEFTNGTQDEVRFECVCGLKRVYVLNDFGTTAMRRHLATCLVYQTEMGPDEAPT